MCTFDCFEALCRCCHELSTVSVGAECDVCKLQLDESLPANPVNDRRVVYNAVVDL